VAGLRSRGPGAALRQRPRAAAAPGGRVFGALNLFGTNVGALGEDDLVLGQALADVATVALVQHRSAADIAVLNAQLSEAVTTRAVLEQAKGVLANQGGLEMGPAFVLMRAYARDRNLRLNDVAKALVSRSLPATRLFE